jgi:hypothetical protein
MAPARRQPWTLCRLRRAGLASFGRDPEAVAAGLPTAVAAAVRIGHALPAAAVDAIRYLADADGLYAPGAALAGERHVSLAAWRRIQRRAAATHGWWRRRLAFRGGRAASVRAARAVRTRVAGAAADGAVTGAGPEAGGRPHQHGDHGCRRRERSYGRTADRPREPRRARRVHHRTRAMSKVVSVPTPSTIRLSLSMSASPFWAPSAR